MAYDPTVWTNDTVPDIDATNLNKMEHGIAEAHELVATAQNGVNAVTQKVNDSIYLEDPTNQVGEYVHGYWSNGVFTATTTNTGRKITIPEGAKKVKVTGYFSRYYDYYDFLDENDNVLSYERKMDTTNPETKMVDIPANAVYVGVSRDSASHLNDIFVYFSYYVNGLLPEMQETVATNTADIIGLKNIEIEGFEKSDYLDITARANLTDGAFAEMYSSNTKVRISTNASYKYCVLDVNPGEIYKTTGVNVFDMRPLIYADDSGNVLGYLPTTRQTTPSVETVEMAVPAGATKLYVDGRTNDNIQILKKGMFYVSGGEDEKDPITVNINSENYLDTEIITDAEAKFKQKFKVFNITDQPNGAVLPRSVEVYQDDTWKTIVNNEDDNCPVNLSSGYLGAGHGYDRARKITAENHGKTYADIGSKWHSGNNDCWLVRIIDENTLIFMGDNASNGYDTNGFTGLSIEYVSGAVHTDNITATKNEQYLIAPVDKNHIKKILLDGKTEVSENGQYTCNSYVDIVDEYDVINPQSIVPEIIANKPSGGYTENPPINTGNVFLHFSNVYRVLVDGTLLLISNLDNNMNVTLSYWGGTQYAQKSSASAFGGALFRYVPKLLPIDNHDLRTPFNMANWNFTINALKEYWEDENNPPDRLLHLFTNGQSQYVAGFAVGYLPIAEGKADTRKNNIGNAMYLYQTKKAYFHLVDTGGVNGNQWSAYTPFQTIIYRKPITDVANVHTDAYFVPCGEKCYLYADYHAVAEDRIKVPAEYIGKKITVLEKSDNVNVYGNIATDEIRIRCLTANPMYGYAVIQIGE